MDWHYESQRGAIPGGIYRVINGIRMPLKKYRMYDEHYTVDFADLEDQLSLTLRTKPLPLDAPTEIGDFETE